jgi:hypothetical protein
MSTLHTDPSRDLRRLAIYFSVLIAVYAAAVAAFWSTPQRGLMFLLVMFAPMVGALAARFTGLGVIQWGRPSWWILAGLIPAILGLGAYHRGGCRSGQCRRPNIACRAHQCADSDLLVGSDCGGRRDRMARLPVAPDAKPQVVSDLLAHRRWHLVAVSPAADSAGLVRDALGLAGIHGRDCRLHAVCGCAHGPIVVALAKRHRARGVERAGCNRFRSDPIRRREVAGFRG